ncbi:MAG TPA: BadF/BadG/BcrA/BcrD ATPase family protein [Clostridia bacterium]|nr:BadF/BadG/BcrA/BcrD ATPase family protein [Clostridia bacterium]
MGYYIGVDGGGTKTAYALFDDKKNIIATFKGPGSNHENMEDSFNQAAAIIWEGVNGLLKACKMSLDDVEFTLMGLAGIDHPFQETEMRKRLEVYGLKNFAIYNDGFIVVMAGSVSGAAIGYNCGTGTCCNAIDSTGKMLQLAGLSELSGDVGNGHWIAQNAYKLIYDDVYLDIEKTALTKKFYDEYSIENRQQFLSKVSEFEGENANSIIMRLIDFFFEAAYEGDRPALSLIDVMATRGAQLISAHANQLTFDGEEIEVVLSGSIHTKLPSDIYIDLMKQKLQKTSNKKFQMIKLENPPVTGCINWIFKQYR